MGQAARQRRGVLVLLGSYVLGQGGYFAALTVLIRQGRLDDVGTIGLGVGLLSLIYLVIDFGGTFLLNSSAARSDVSDRLASAIAARLVLALLILAVLTPLAWSRTEPYWSVVAGGSWGAVFAAGNLTGLLDAHGRQWVSAIGNLLLWLPVSIFLVSATSPMDLGLAGSFYALGMTAQVIWQCAVALRRSELRSGVVKGPLMIEFAARGHSYTVAVASGQLFARVVPMMIEQTSGPIVLGLYVYAKQILSVFGQVAAFARRVEFRSLLHAVRGQAGWRQLLALQKRGLILSLWIPLLAILAWPALSLVRPGSAFSEVGVYLAVFALPIPLWYLATSLGQAAIATNDYSAYMRGALLTAASGSFLAYLILAVLQLNPLAVVVAEFAAYGIYAAYFARALPIDVSP